MSYKKNSTNYSINTIVTSCSHILYVLLLLQCIESCYCSAILLNLLPLSFPFTAHFHKLSLPHPPRTEGGVGVGDNSGVISRTILQAVESQPGAGLRRGFWRGQALSFQTCLLPAELKMWERSVFGERWLLSYQSWEELEAGRTPVTYDLTLLGELAWTGTLLC